MLTVPVIVTLAAVGVYIVLSTVVQMSLANCLILSALFAPVVSALALAAPIRVVPSSRSLALEGSASVPLVGMCVLDAHVT